MGKRSSAVEAAARGAFGQPGAGAWRGEQVCALVCDTGSERKRQRALGSLVVASTGSRRRERKVLSQAACE